MTIISKLLPTLRTSGMAPAIIQTSKFSLPRSFSSQKERGLAKSQEKADVSTDVRPLGEKIKETTKTVSYTGVILAGIGVTGVIFYYVFRELFSSNSPNSIYSEALEKCKNVSESVVFVCVALIRDVYGNLYCLHNKLSNSLSRYT